MYINSEIKAIASQELQNEVSAELSQEDKAIATILSEIKIIKETNERKSD